MTHKPTKGETLMPDFTPTAEQIAIVNAAKDTDTNLAVIARAGAAKTSTLILIAEALPQTDILCLAFNKAIATEMAERLPPNCEAKTLHGLGYKAWWQFIRVKCKVNDRKVYGLLRDRIDTLTGDDRSEAFESMAETLDFIKKGKAAGYLPDAYQGHWRPLINDEDFFEALPMEPSRLQISLIQDVSAASFKLALTGEIDFDDMIFCPAICSVTWPKPTLTLVDESQDLSPINHHILKKIVKNRRLIAVGDPCQAIYGFRGADSQSMQNMIQMFKMETLSLTISFRCSRAVTENARWRAPDMKSPEWATKGEVLRPIDWSAEEINLGDAIICRNNAPLFSMAIKMIEHDLLPEIAGRDIGGPLKKIMKKLGSEKQLRLAALNALDDWRNKELKRAREGAKGNVEDKYSCIEIMLNRTKTLGDAIAYLDHLLARDGRIHLMTGHKSKGLEFDTVWFLDQHLCRIKHEQDANIKYVIETRAKDKLIYVTAESFEATDETE
jgi:superfamily I DNA/RNA helicase